MIDWGVACWRGALQGMKAHAIIDGEAACGERPREFEHNFNSICKRCDAHVRKEM